MPTTPAPLLTSLTGALPDVPDAVRVGDAALSREQVLGAATAVADRIAGSPAVAVDAQPSIETVVAAAGCLVAGVPLVPVPKDAGPDERTHIVRDSGAALWLGSPRDEVELPAVPVDVRASSSTAYREPPADAAAMIMYTSGTTGPPKGVVLSRAAVAADLDALAQAWGWTQDDVLVHGLPLFHVHGLVLGVFGALRVGSRLHHTVRPLPQAYAEASGTLYFGVPTVWSRLCDDPTSARRLAGARLLVSGSAPLPVPVFDRLAELTGQPPVERYGMSETLITVSTRHDGERRPGWVGLPLAGVETRLRAEDGAPVPHDGEQIGQLQVRGATLFDEYLHNPDKTAAEHTDDGWFRTGDVATIDAGGFHRIVGRESVDLIKSGGYRVGAGEVEHALLAHPGVRDAAVVGLPDPDLGQRIVAYVVGDVDEPDRVIDFVAQTLAVHKRPREVRVMGELPRNQMGKVQKKQLMQD